MALMGLSKPDKRIKDIELVLRFSAFFHQTYLNYKPPMRLFLNREMEKYQFISDNDESDLRVAFKNSIITIKSLLAKHAFKRYYTSVTIKDHNQIKTAIGNKRNLMLRFMIF